MWNEESFNYLLHFTEILYWLSASPRQASWWKKSNVDSLFRLLALVASTEIAWANWSACSWLTFHFRLKTASDPSLFLECALGMTVWRGELPGQNRMPTGLSGGGCGQSCLGHSDNDRSCGGLWTDTVSRIVLLQLGVNSYDHNFDCSPINMRCLCVSMPRSLGLPW